MQTFSVKVRPKESVKQTKRNGEWVKRYNELYILSLKALEFIENMLDN